MGRRGPITQNKLRGTAWATSRRSALEEVIVIGWGGLVCAVSASRARRVSDELVGHCCAPEEVFVDHSKIGL